MDLFTFNEQALRILQTAEFKNTVGGWIETINPELGQNFYGAYQNVRSFDHTSLNEALYLCESLFDRISTFTDSGDLFCSSHLVIVIGNYPSRIYYGQVMKKFFHQVNTGGF